MVKPQVGRSTGRHRILTLENLPRRSRNWWYESPHTLRPARMPSGRIFRKNSIPFEDDQVFRTSRIEREVGNCIFGWNKIRVVELGLKFLCVFGKDDAISSATCLSWTHA